MRKVYAIIFALLLTKISLGQLLIARDTISVIENNHLLKMPWANGINYANISNIDLNYDGKKDLVAFDKPTSFGPGRFRCFINVGTPGQTKYKAAPDLSYSFPFLSSWAVCLDYDCDGWEDIFCSANGGITVYRNTGSQTTGLSFALVKTFINSDYNPSGPGPSSFSPIYASSIGVPGIADIDGDGDLDILTFSSQGFYLEYHRNMSKEKGYLCDSLIYRYESPCWGKIEESQCVISMNQCNPKPVPPGEPSLKEEKRHYGSCLSCFDTNGDNLLDLVMGDTYCNYSELAVNTSSLPTALITYTSAQYPNATNPIQMSAFPCAYIADCDGDGKKDLVATPNVFGSENINSMWYYKNTSTTNTVNFQFVKNNFLQDEMIEVGLGAFPLIFDYDLDGRKDLLIGNYGYYDPVHFKAQLALYKNIGTPAQPSFSLITKDFAGLAVQNLNNAMPTTGDIDGDGDVDILVGTSSGQIHWLEKTGVTGNYTFHNNSYSITTQSAEAAPQLFDIDSDNDLDLMVGTKNGRIAYYQNIGTTAAPIFTLITNYFGSVDVKGDINLYGIDGYAVPYFYKVGAATKLLVGNVNGQIFYYDVPSVLTNSCNLINTSANNINEGSQAAVCFEDVNNDGKRDLFVGNGSGGLSFFSSMNQFVGIKENAATQMADNIVLFPNPASNFLNLRINTLEFESGRLVLYDLLGKEIENMEITANTQTFILNNTHKGIYFAKVFLTHNAQTASFTKKIIIN